MTAIPQPSFSLGTETPDRRTLVVRVTGAIDHESYDTLVDAVERHLVRHPGLRELRLDCAGLHGVDALGLSGILMVHRLTEGAGVRLRLDHRPARLERLLARTGTLDHLTADDRPERGLGTSEPA